MATYAFNFLYLLDEDGNSSNGKVDELVENSAGNATETGVGGTVDDDIVSVGEEFDVEFTDGATDAQYGGTYTYIGHASPFVGFIAEDANGDFFLFSNNTIPPHTNLSGFVAEDTPAPGPLPANTVSVYTDDTLTTLDATYDGATAFSDALTDAVAGEAIAVDDPDTLGDVGTQAVTAENLTIIANGPFDASLPLSGGAHDLTLEGTSDIDVVANAGGGGTIKGNAGDNQLTGQGGDDALDGGAGNDTLLGGAGFDRARYDRATAGVTVDLAITVAQDTGGAGTDTLGGIENANGSAFGDSLSGDGAANVLNGRGGDDVLVGRGGDDTLVGGAGDDSLDGGFGNDTARYAFSGATAGVTVDLAVTGAQVTGAGTDTLTSIENLLGAEFADSLSGNGVANALTGREGDDTLAGRGGDDLLIGGLGADLLAGALGVDTVGYDDVLESTSQAYDTIVGFDASAEFFDLPVVVTGIDSTIASGALNDASFDTDLAAAVAAATLLAQHAVLFTPDSGDHAGEMFLIVDANGAADYQASEDFVFRLDNPVSIGSLSTDRFV